jgi:7-cyano-7-deazaguanine synthase
MIFLAIAAGYAQTIGAGCVVYAAHSNDRAIYPDCRPEFVRSCAETVKLGTGSMVEVLAPFVGMTKVDIVKLGKRLNVPFRLCWSCYKGEERPCLKCGTDVERTEAFKLAGFPDPALTPEEWSKALEYLEEVSK